MTGVRGSPERARLNAGLPPVVAHFGQSSLQRERRTIAGIDQLLGAGEVGRAVGGQRRLDQHVLRLQRGQLRFGITPGHHGSGLVEHIDHGHQLLARFERSTDIHHDQTVDAHVTRHIHGDVVHHAAVDEQPVIDLHRREHRGNRHARADHLAGGRGGRPPFVIGDVGGYGAERNRQLVEVAGVAGMHQQAFEQQ